MVFKGLTRALVAALATLAVTVTGAPFNPADYKILTISEFSSSFETQTLIALNYQGTCSQVFQIEMRSIPKT